MLTQTCFAINSVKIVVDFSTRDVLDSATGVDMFCKLLIWWQQDNIKNTVYWYTCNYSQGHVAIVASSADHPIGLFCRVKTEGTMQGTELF